MLSFVLSTAVSLWSITRLSNDHIRDINTMIAARVYIAIDRSLREPIAVAKTMASDSFLKEALENEDGMSEDEESQVMKKYLSEMKEGLGYESTFVISDSSRRYYSYDGLSKIIDTENDPADAWYIEFVRSEMNYDLDVDYDHANGNMWTVFVNARVHDGARLLGVCGVGVEMTNMQELFAEYESKYNVKIDLVDSEGVIQIDTDEGSIESEFADRDILTGSSSDDYVYHQKGNSEFAVTKYVENLGWYLVVSSNGSDTGSRFLKVILLNMGLCLLVLFIIATAMKVSVSRVKDLHTASVIDSLTGMNNRRAYEDEKERLTSTELPPDFICMTADVNGLKEVNDNLGHEAGDELIKGAAYVLQSCFGGIGTVYRTGGDEFAGLFNASEEKLEGAKKRLAEILGSWQVEKCGRLAISCGYASRREFPSAGISELSSISDERMYEAKREYYKTHDRRRRR